MAVVFQNMESQFFESTVRKEIEYNIIKKYAFRENSVFIERKNKNTMERTGLDENT